MSPYVVLGATDLGNKTLSKQRNASFFIPSRRNGCSSLDPFAPPAGTGSSPRESRSVAKSVAGSLFDGDTREGYVESATMVRSRPAAFAA